MNRLLLVLASTAALWSTACSSGGGTTVVPPPTGKFSASSLNGTYAFMTNGEVITSAGAEVNLSRVGSFIANGQGGITGGVEDVNSAGTVNPAVPITGGNYTVNANGTGSLTLNITSAGTPSSITLGITLTSTSGGLMVDETSTAAQASTGSGNFMIQNVAVCSSPVTSVSGTYVFDFAGADAGGNPESLVGEFAVSGGVISTGFTDANDFLVLSNGSIGGSFALDPISPASSTSCGRGVAEIAGQPFEYYVVDATRIRFISITNGAMLTGDAVIQANPPANLSTSFAFLVAGNDSNGFVTRLGRFTGNGTALTNVVMDTNDGSIKFTPTGGAGSTITAASITPDPVNPGRFTLTFKDSNLSVPFSFVLYLSSATSGVIQDITQTGGFAIQVADGTIGAQTGSPFSSSNITGTYAVNWSGTSQQVQGQDEEDLIGQATISSAALTGTADIFQMQALAPQMGNVLSGNITFGGDGSGGDGNRNTMVVTLTKGSTTTVHFVVYFVNPQLVFFANNNNQGGSRSVAGILQLQP
jgi:hypothetical protein